jgi:hypothetical protein
VTYELHIVHWRLTSVTPSKNIKTTAWRVSGPLYKTLMLYRSSPRIHIGMRYIMTYELQFVHRRSTKKSGPKPRTIQQCRTCERPTKRRRGDFEIYNWCNYHMHQSFDLPPAFVYRKINKSGPPPEIQQFDDKLSRSICRRRELLSWHTRAFDLQAAFCSWKINKVWSKQIFSQRCVVWEPSTNVYEKGFSDVHHTRVFDLRTSFVCRRSTMWPKARANQEIVRVSDPQTSLQKSETDV